MPSVFMAPKASLVIPRFCRAMSAGFLSTFLVLGMMFLDS